MALFNADINKQSAMTGANGNTKNMIITEVASNVAHPSDHGTRR